MNLKSALVALSILTASFSAQAEIVEWGPHGDYRYTSIVHETAGAFEDFFAFNLFPANDLFSTAVSNNIHNIANISGGKVELYQGSLWDGNPDALIGSYNFDGTTGNSPATFDLSNAGDYYYRVTGMATGTHGGNYTLSSAPVPEPETYAMLIAGLGATLVARRRKAA